MRVCSVLWVYVVHVANTFQLCLTGARFIYNNNARFSTNISLLIFIIFLYAYSTWVYEVHVTNACLLCITGTRFLFTINGRFSTNISFL